MRLILTSLAVIVFGTPALASKKDAREPGASHKKPSESSAVFDLSKATFKDILDRYVFIADFNQKPAERPVSGEFFWKYPFKLAPVKFDLDLDSANLKSMVFQVKGEGRKAEAFNIGRVAFLEGEHQKAHDIWLNARMLFKDDAATNKIFEFFMGVNALSAYKKRLSEPGIDANSPELKAYLQRVAYFFSSAFILRRDIPEPRIESFIPWAFYNLSVIYYKFDRIPSVFGAAEAGLAELLKQGSRFHRSEMRQLVAEAYIRNQDLISAIQELDTAIRQDPDQAQAARMFNRAGDIYYDLNNYELAEDLYAMASAIDRERLVYNPGQAFLRAESVFWLGRFAEAESLFKGAVDYAMRSPGSEWLQDSGTIPWAWLRVADSLLARGALAKGDQSRDILAKARLAYFKVQTDFPKSEAAKIAELRGACMELPKYEGNNVKHARELLATIKEKNELPQVLMEMVWACDAESYSDREKNDTMVAKIQEFAEKYPNSRFLNPMLSPVREVQGSKINQYFDKRQWEEATDFFEQKRKALFPKVSRDLGGKLWVAYVSTSRSEAAVPFWGHAEKDIKTDTAALRQATFLYEVGSEKGKTNLSKERSVLNSALLRREWGAKPSNEDMNYLSRLLVTSNVSEAYPWILRLLDAWTADDKDALCSTVFPFLSRINADRKSPVAAKKEVYRRVGGLTAGDVVALRENDKSCFQSWLDFEAKILRPDDLKKKYSARDDWPLEGAWLERMWTWSEELNGMGRKSDAQAAWKKIAEKAPKDSFEGRMAVTRLDPKKTEFESLWK